jgi:hypothetical protein
VRRDQSELKEEILLKVLVHERARLFDRKTTRVLGLARPQPTLHVCEHRLIAPAMKLAKYKVEE